MRTPSSINGKLFKPTSVTCWDSSQLQELKKMKLPLLFSSTVAICLAGPQYLRNYGISSNLRSQAYGRNFANQRVQSSIGSLSSLSLGLRGNHAAQGNYLGYLNGGQLKTYSNFQNYLAKNDLCGESGLAFMETILSGGSGAQAQANAEAAYKAAWARGARILPGSACAASEVAFKEAYASGNADATLESARAFVDNWPGLKEGNPCAVSGKAYMDAILVGNSVDSAGLISGKAFIVAFGDAARSGKQINDPACAAAAKTFIDAANPPDSASAESAKAFIDATLTTSSSGYDPVCAASALAYMDAFASGKDPLTSNLIAAKAFFLEYTKGTTPGVDSPCVKATLAYASRSPSPSPANRDAMVAFINQAVNDREAFFDPVCGAATIAFLDAKIAGKSDKEAGAASAEAYIEAFAANGGRRTEACKRSAEAYIKTF